MNEEKNRIKESELEFKLDNVQQSSTRKIVIVDTAGNVSYSLIAGCILDYCAGLNLAGILASRTSATIMNSVTGGFYGWWREKTFRMTKTNKESGRLRKTLVDLLAFNTFQLPLYAGMIAVGSFVSEGKVDMKKVYNGATYLATISPFISPTLGWYLDGCRRLFNVKPAVEGAYIRDITEPKK